MEEDILLEENWAAEIVLVAAGGIQVLAEDTQVVPTDTLHAGRQGTEGRDCLDLGSAEPPSDQLGRAGPCLLISQLFANNCQLSQRRKPAPLMTQSAFPEVTKGKRHGLF